MVDKKVFFKKVLFTISLSFLVVLLIFLVVFFSGFFKSCCGNYLIPHNNSLMGSFGPTSSRPLLLNEFELSFNIEESSNHIIEGGFFNRRNHSVFVNFYLDRCVMRDEFYISDECNNEFVKLNSLSHPLFVDIDESVGFYMDIDLSCGEKHLPLGAYVCLLKAYECVDLISCGVYSNQSILESQQILFQII